MNQTALYESLARKLDQGVIIGAPLTSTLIEILEILFPPEEAEIALKLPNQNKPLSELKALYPDRADGLGEILDRMARRGTVYSAQKPGQEKVYRLLPSVVGWSETPYWAGRDTPEARNLAPLWIKYRDEAFGAELARGLPALRVIPIAQALKDESQILPFDALIPMVEAASYRAVGHCPCRQMQKYVGQGCQHTLENCLHFGGMGRYMVEQGLARAISLEETLKILAEAHQEGLVHCSENIEGALSTICNCCGCCCMFLITRKKLGLTAVSSSNYLARVEAEACQGCGTCEERCPVAAIAVNDDGVAEVKENVCLGCGVCTPTCPAEAVALVLRPEILRPPDVSQFLTARYKA
ncbi:MAG: 4Fe-4S dicluster domain-containing protein [Thermodesulfobacteriota bacterium]